MNICSDYNDVMVETSVEKINHCVACWLLYIPQVVVIYYSLYVTLSECQVIDAVTACAIRALQCKHHLGHLIM